MTFTLFFKLRQIGGQDAIRRVTIQVVNFIKKSSPIGDGSAPSKLKSQTFHIERTRYQWSHSSTASYASE